MLTCFIRNFSILLIAIYTFYKLLNIAPKEKHVQVLLVFLSMIVSLCTAVLFITNQSLNWLFILLLLFLMIKYVTKINLSTTYITALFSFALSFIAFTISGIITSFALFPLYFKEYEIPWFLIRAFVSIIQFLLVYCCFRIPRLRKGMAFLYHIPSGNTGSTLCIILIMLIIMFSQAKTATESFMLGFNSVILILSFTLIYWWNYQLTQTYKKYLKKNEIDSLNRLLEEKNLEIAHLRNENDKLSRIIHKDNKLLPALSMAVTDFLENKNKLPLSDLEQHGSSLQTQLKTLYNDRLEILANYQQEILPLPSTNFSSIDAVLMYMQQKALQLGIQYQLILSDDWSAIIPDMISEKDCSHLLSDLLDNAIIAAQDTSSAIIRIHIGRIDGIHTIKIYNTGQPFHIDTLKNIGIARHTTHGDTGGSGIGLMDIWTIKEKYAATLLIDEISNTSSATPYTCINILFNHKNHYIIQSDRYKELIASINRPDLLILSKE